MDYHVDFFLPASLHKLQIIFNATLFGGGINLIINIDWDPPKGYSFYGVIYHYLHHLVGQPSYGGISIPAWKYHPPVSTLSGVFTFTISFISAIVVNASLDNTPGLLHYYNH